MLRWLEQVGDWMIVGIQSVVAWIVEAWERVSGKA